MIAAAAISLGGGNDAQEGAEYAKAIGGICSELDRERAEKPARDRELGKRLLSATTVAGQRNVLLEEYKREIAVNGDAVGRLEALTAPDEGQARTQGATAKVWVRSLTRRQEVRDEFDDAASYRQLARVAKGVDRSAFERDARVVTTGLRRLGDGECELRREPDRPVVPLNKSGGERDVAPPAASPPPTSTVGTGGGPAVSGPDSSAPPAAPSPPDVAPPPDALPAPAEPPTPDVAPGGTGPDTSSPIGE